MLGETVVRLIKLVLAGLLLTGLFGSAESFAAAASPTTRTHSGGGVTVKITLLDSKTNGDLSFQIVLDTHSVNLDAYDLKTITVLRDGGGNTYHPIGLENKGSGHHRQATVTFAKIANSPKRFELVLRDIAGIKERVFRWDLE
jgi:hypothetical protein